MNREEVWHRAWIALAAGFNVREHQVATRWADACLAAFDERFPATIAQPKSGD